MYLQTSVGRGAAQDALGHVEKRIPGECVLLGNGAVLDEIRKSVPGGKV